jgi:hypothetical protein
VSQRYNTFCQQKENTYEKDIFANTNIILFAEATLFTSLRLASIYSRLTSPRFD